MERQQIIGAWDNGAYGGGQFTTTHDNSEQYYNETFKTNKNKTIMEIKFENKQEENLFNGSIIVLAIAGLSVAVSIFYSILE